MTIIANQEQRRAIHLNHGRTVEVVTVECSHCHRAVKKKCDHKMTDLQIALQYFPGWKIRGVRRAVWTLCPKCLKK